MNLEAQYDTIRGLVKHILHEEGPLSLFNLLDKVRPKLDFVNNYVPVQIALLKPESEGTIIYDSQTHMYKVH